MLKSTSSRNNKTNGFVLLVLDKFYDSIRILSFNAITVQFMRPQMLFHPDCVNREFVERFVVAAHDIAYIADWN